MEQQGEDNREKEENALPGSGGRTQRSEAETLGHWESVNYLLDEVETLRADRSRLELEVCRAEGEAVSLRLAGCDLSGMPASARALCEKLASEREERIKALSVRMLKS